MANPPFLKLSSTLVALDQENIDTDQIIPSRFLKATDRTGFGKNLFCDWRYYPDGTIKEDFVLNSSGGKGSILLTGHNFGCGSSREHAAWALYDYGFRVIISSYFADIFKSNALNNALLPIQVEPSLLRLLFDGVLSHPNAMMEVNLENQTWTLPDLTISHFFEISAYKKTCLLNGYDDLDYVLSHNLEIKEFENRRAHEKKYLSYFR